MKDCFHSGKDVHCPSESNLEVEIDCSSIGWDQYRDLLLQLGDILTTIDEAHSVKSWSVRGRSVRSRYKRVTQEDRRRRIRFSPFPSSFSNTLTNTRAHVYELVHQHCLVLEHVGARKCYLLPKLVAPDFVAGIESLNEDVVDKLNKSIMEFTGTTDYLSVEQSLHNHGVDPSVLRTSSFTIGQFRADVIPVNMGYSVNSDEYYDQMGRDKASKGFDLLKEQVDRKYKEYSMGAMKDLWIKLKEDICEDYRLGLISQQEAIEKLVDMGFGPYEALDLIEEAVS